MHSRRSAVTQIVFLFIVFVGVRTAQAGGYHYPDLGTVGLSRGGAFVARADDPTAIYYNPAGAARLKGTHILLNGNVLFENIRFQRRIYPSANYPNRPLDAYPHDASLTLPEVQNVNGPFPAPFGAVTTDLGFLDRYNLVMLFGMYGPNAAGRRTFPRFCVPGQSPCVETTSEQGVPSPSRYDLLDLEILLLYPSVGLAWRGPYGLSFGGVFQLGYAQFTYVTTVTAAGAGSELPAGDVVSRTEVNSSLTPTGILGLHYAPTSFLEFGASSRIGFTFQTEGTIESTVPPTVKEVVPFDFDAVPNPAPAKIAIPKAWVVRTGARYIARDGKGRERFDLEFDFVWESTSKLKEFLVDTTVDVIDRAHGNTIVTVEDVKIRHEWNDSLSLRLGGSYQFYELFSRQVDLALRGGSFFETAATSTQFTRLDFLPLSRIGLAVGISLRWKNYEVSVGYAHLFHQRKEVAPDEGTLSCDETVTPQCGSVIKQIAPLRPEYEGGAVGNGTYDVSIDELTIGLKAVL